LESCPVHFVFGNREVKVTIKRREKSIGVASSEVFCRR